MKIFKGIEVIEALATYSELRVYAAEDSDDGRRLVDFDEALEIAMTSPSTIWAELGENEMKRHDEDSTGTVCEACGMVCMPSPSALEVTRLLDVREKLMRYVEGDESALDTDAALYASMALGVYESMISR